MVYPAPGCISITWSVSVQLPVLWQLLSRRGQCLHGSYWWPQPSKQHSVIGPESVAPTGCFCRDICISHLDLMESAPPVSFPHTVPPSLCLLFFSFSSHRNRVYSFLSRFFICWCSSSFRYGCDKVPNKSNFGRGVYVGSPLEGKVHHGGKSWGQELETAAHCICSQNVEDNECSCSSFLCSLGRNQAQWLC